MTTKRFSIKAAIHNLFSGQVSTVSNMNKRVELSVAERLQAELAKMTNWQLTQYQRHIRANPHHGKELAVAQAFAILDHNTRSFVLPEELKGQVNG